MRRLVCASAALAFAIAPAGAEHRYDRKLEQAVMKIVADKIGDLRGGFSYRQKPQLVAAPEAASPGAAAAQGADAAASSTVALPEDRPNS